MITKTRFISIWIDRDAITGKEMSLILEIGDNSKNLTHELCEKNNKFQWQIFDTIPVSLENVQEFDRRKKQCWFNLPANQQLVSPKRGRRNVSSGVFGRLSSIAAIAAMMDGMPHAYAL